MNARQQIEGLLCECEDDVVRAAAANLLDKFELVFGADWETTLANLRALDRLERRRKSLSARKTISLDDLRVLMCHPTRRFPIAPSGTFLEPGLADESSNWANRGALLCSYRTLKALLQKPEQSGS